MSAEVRKKHLKGIATIPHDVTSFPACWNCQTFISMQRLQRKCLLPYEVSTICSSAHCDGSRVIILVFGRPLNHDLEPPLSIYVLFLQCSIRLFTLLLKFQQSEFAILCILSISIDTDRYIYLDMSFTMKNSWRVHVGKKSQDIV